MAFNGGFNIMDVDNGFYMVKFNTIEDKEKVRRWSLDDI